MIFDKISNISNYNIPENVINFIKNIDNNIEKGKHIIDDNNYANVDVYSTKAHEVCKLEAHEKYVDIQILLCGKERIDFIDIDDLEVSEAYCDSRDIMFFHTPASILNSVVLEKGKFAVLYPNEAHMPQMNCGNNSCEVKKVVIKIKVN